MLSYTIGNFNTDMLHYIYKFKFHYGDFKNMETLNTSRLIECRQKLGITKQEAAKRVQVSQPAYLRYEAGQRNPSVQVIAKMAEVFSTSVDYLIGKTEAAEADSILIESKKTPALFTLNEKCKDLDDAQIKRILAYVEKLSNK